MPRDFHQHSGYRALKSLCERTFASADRSFGFSFALVDALRAVGLPCLTSRQPVPEIEEAARTLVAAFDAATVRRRYL
jgi:hypothetical protein